LVAETVDGFRVDTVKHMESAPRRFLQRRAQVRKDGKQNFYFRRIVADDTLATLYLPQRPIEGTNERFPSLNAALRSTFSLEDHQRIIDPAPLRDRYERFKTLYADHARPANISRPSSNHDQMPARLTSASCSNPFPQQAALAIGYLLTSQGVPCICHGTEQGFDGGGDNDSFVRECMFGGGWGAFESTLRHFFLPANPIYKSIAQIAAIRRSESALRYGRQYFREISGNGIDFGYPNDGKCTLAYSRILDTTEILVALNLAADPRADFATVDRT
jgi:glycosidase